MHPPRQRPLRANTARLCLIALIAVGSGCVRDEAEGVLHEIELPTGDIEPVVDMTMRPEDMPPGRTELILSSTPYLGEAEIVRAFKPIAAAITRRLGVPVRFELARSYQEMIERSEKREIDIMQLSPLSYVLARDAVSNLRLVGSSLSFGSTSYSSFLVVRAQDEITSLADLRGRRVGFVDERSGSGFLFPYAAFLQHDIDPERDLKIVFTGGHKRSLDLLRDHQIDAAAVSSGTLNNARRGKVIGEGDLRILYKAGRIPYDALCTSPAVPESGARKIAAAFGSLSTRTQDGRAALYLARGLTGWVRSDDSRYDEVRETLKLVRANRWRGWLPDQAAAPRAATRTDDHDAP